MTAAPLLDDDRSSRSVFAGADVCREAGLELPAGVRGPVFEDDLWDFTEVIGLPVQMARFNRRFNFPAIARSSWRLVAKELIMALLAPRHDEVASLPRAYRIPLHVNTANQRPFELTRWLNWLAKHGIDSLADIYDACRQAYLPHRRYIRDTDGVVVGQRSHAIRRSAAQIVVDLVNYRDLFSTDRVNAQLRPWSGASASAIPEMPNGRTQNKTPPLAQDILKPMLAAAHYLVTTLGPHAIKLSQQVRQAD